MNNPFFEYLDLVDRHPEQFDDLIKRQVKKQREALELFEFREERGRVCVEWIEENCILTEGEHAGEKVKLLLWQKWFIYSIFCFYMEVDEPIIAENGEVIGSTKKKVRLVNDVTLMVASGNAKTTTMAFILTYLLYGPEFKAPQMYIGSFTHEQARHCYEQVKNNIERNRALSADARILDSRSKIFVDENNSRLFAMSSKGDNQEGIIPSIIYVDETHLMRTNTYVNDLKKSTKRSDLLYIETTTQGRVRGGYLDERLKYLEDNLKLEGKWHNYRTFCAIYQQESEEEIFEALDKNQPAILYKSNPSLFKAVDYTLLFDAIKLMRIDDSKRATTLTKNFNIPQNSASSYFGAVACQTPTFNEECLKGALVFVGLDMAETNEPRNDLTSLTFMVVDPIEDVRYIKDILLLPKYWHHQYIKEGEYHDEMKDMLKEKSIYDANIPCDKRNGIYGYEKYAERGDVLVIDEELNEKLVARYGEEARSNMTSIDENLVIHLLAYLQHLYGFRIVKFGLDPQKATRIESFHNANLRSFDGKPVCIRFDMQVHKLSNPTLERMKRLRNEKRVYCNNKLSELHFADVEYSERKDGFVLENQHSKRKDAVISQASAESAYNAFISNKDTGEMNRINYTNWWKANGKRIKELAQTSTKILQVK